MYTILIKDDNTLRQTNKENIMHRESNMHTFQFLVNPTWSDKGIETDMRNYTCICEFRTPINEKYIPLILTPSDDLYKNKLEYLVPIDTRFTATKGNLELKFTFTWLEMNADGTFTEHSRETTSTIITIIPTEQWSDYVSSSDLSSIAEMVLTLQAQNEQTRLYNEQIYLNSQKIANTVYGLDYNEDTNELSLQKNGKADSTVVLEDGNCDCEDGIPVVDIDENQSDSPVVAMIDNVVEI